MSSNIESTTEIPEEVNELNEYGYKPRKKQTEPDFDLNKALTWI